MKRGKTVKLPFVAYSVIRGKQIVLWKSSKPKVATVRKGKAAGELSVKSNANSKLTIKAGKKLGTSKITLTTVNGKRFVIKVKVVKDLKAVAKKSVKIRKLTVKAAKRLRVGQTKRLKASFTKKATAIATWKSSNPKVAKIDASGKLTAVKKGKAKITLKVGGNKKVIKITVR
ncbi:MAG: Ig-like domain-containing protein [Clostridiales Family XIII bacterium]|nr:Ig-like domain-containing protein [Clostridiales Family XIII bacterium]